MFFSVASVFFAITDPGGGVTLLAFHRAQNSTD
jgi:hypothetical protein